MASIIGVETLQHTNGTTAATINSSGFFVPKLNIVQTVKPILALLQEHHLQI